jgi:hypothetical protein
VDVRSPGLPDEGDTGGEWAAGFADCGTVLGTRAADVEPRRVTLVTVSISLAVETVAGGGLRGGTAAGGWWREGSST